MDAKPTRTGSWYYPRGTKVPTSQGTRHVKKGGLKRAGCILYDNEKGKFSRKNCGKGKNNNKIHGICYVKPKGESIAGVLFFSREVRLSCLKIHL